MAAHTDLSAFHTSEAQLALKYQGVIHEVGPFVEECLLHGILIFFGDMAPPELRELALVHNGTQLISELAAGDLVKFSPSDATQSPSWYRLTAVGEQANANLTELGHVVLYFDGATKAKLPGAVSVEPELEALPTIGTTFEFFGLKE